MRHTRSRIPNHANHNIILKHIFSKNLKWNFKIPKLIEQQQSKSIKIKKVDYVKKGIIYMHEFDFVGQNTQFKSKMLFRF